MIKTKRFPTSSLVLVFVAAALIVSGFFAPNGAFADLTSLTVTGPNGGELLGGGGTFNIEWISTGGTAGDLIDIALIDEVVGSSIAVSTGVAFDASPFAWTALPSVVNGINYKIRILKAGTAIVYDTSDGAFSVDNTPPTITSVTTYDDSGDGNVDKATIVFSEPVRDTSFAANNFSIDGQPGTSIVSGTTDDDTLDVLFSGVTGTGPKTLVYTPGSGHDLADPGNLLAAVPSFPATDAAAPVFLSAKTKTVTTIEATFSEDIDGNTLNTSGTEFTVAGHTVSGASETSPGVITLTLSTTMGTGEKPAVTFTNIDNFKDNAGNQALSPVTRTATDGVTPILAEVTPVTTPTLDDTPDYTFSSSEAGAINYGGPCTSGTSSANFGNNPITFNSLEDGTYSTCTITVTDLSGNKSNPLAVSSFQIDTTPVTVANITNETGALQIGSNPVFTPPLGTSLLRTADSFYAVRAISILGQPIPNVLWKVTIIGPSTLLPTNFSLVEVGWEDILNTPTVTTENYNFTCNGTTCIAETTDGATIGVFDVDPTDNFKNVDRVNFAATAPLGTYTIKRVLVLGGGTPVSNELDVATFTVTNNPPVLDTITNQEVDELVELTFTATATDVEESTLAFSLIGEPTGASINPATGGFSWTPTEAQGPGTYSFTVQVADVPDGGTASELIQVAVNEVNIAPVATVASATTNEDTAVTIILPATDADIPVNTLIFSIVGSPSNGTLGAVVGNQVTYTPNLNYNGPDSFTFKVNDGTVDSNIATVSITVNPVNDAPELALIADQVTTASVSLSFDADATDVELDTLTFSLVGAPVGASIDPSTGVFTWKPTVADIYTFDVVVSDGGLNDTQIVQVTVNHAAIAKVVISAEPTNLSVENQSTITVTGKDQFGNVTTSDNSTVVVLSADNGGALGNTLPTLTNGVAQTTLSRSSAGDVHVNASSGILTPSQVTVTFNAVPGDTTAPTILSHTPADDAINVPVEIVPLLLFSEPLKSITVNSANIQLKKYSDDSAVPAVVSLVEGGTQVNIDPVSPLENNTQYYFAVSTGVQDEVGNPLATAFDATTKAAHEFTTVELGGIVIDDITLPSPAEANNTYLDGWHYVFKITINNPDETDLFVKFADWVKTADGEETVPVFDNTRLLLNAGVGVGLIEGDIEGGFSLGNGYEDQTLDGVPTAVDISGVDNNLDKAGRQVQFDVFVKLPVDTAPGFYTTEYGLLTK